MNGYEITLKFKLFTPAELDSLTFNEFLNLFREAFQQAVDVQGDYTPLPREYTRKILQQAESRFAAWVEGEASSPGGADEADDHYAEAAGGRIETEAQMDELDRGGSLGVTHPWDQGLWFFPENHPMAPYERAAKRHYDGGVTTHKASPEEITQRAIEMGYKELPNGED